MKNIILVSNLENSYKSGIRRKYSGFSQEKIRFCFNEELFDYMVKTGESTPCESLSF